MALKDWTKTGKNEWHKFVSKTKKSGKFYDGIFIVKTINGDYTVDSYYRQVPKRFLYKKGRLNTYKKALRMAKLYMIEH